MGFNKLVLELLPKAASCAADFPAAPEKLGADVLSEMQECGRGQDTNHRHQRNVIFGCSINQGMRHGVGNQQKEGKLNDL